MAREHVMPAILAMSALFLLDPALAQAEEPVPAPEPGWIIEDWTPAYDDAGQSGAEQVIGADEDVPERRKPALPSMRFGNSDLSLGSVEGAPGATLEPDNSSVSLGFGVQPLESSEIDPLEGRRYNEDPAPLAGFDNGLSGALSLSETKEGVTQSMSVTSPLSGDSEARETETGGNDVRTMFGLGLQF